MEDSGRSFDDARLRALFRAVVDPFVAIDRCGLILATNPAVEKVFGWTQDELVGHNVSRLMAEPYRSEHDGYIKAYQDTGVSQAIGRIRDVMGRRKNGEVFPCQISISEVLEDEGQLSYVGIVRDMTEREQLSARLAQIERLAAVGELAAGVAHEVNNPINTILNCAQLMLDGDTDRELLEDIQHEGKRIVEIVRGLLDFASNRDNGDEEADLAAVVEKTAALIRRRLRESGIQLEITMPKDLPPVRGRFQQLEQVMLNLILNSRDALLARSGEDANLRPPQIRIDAEVSEDVPPRVRLRVTDNGTGISPELQSKIFEPFFTTKRGRGGTGLGLSISHGIIESHGGRIWVASEPGRSCTFYVSLPVA